MLEFPREGLNLRKSAVFCENLRFGHSLSPYFRPLKRPQREDKLLAKRPRLQAVQLFDSRLVKAEPEQIKGDGRNRMGTKGSVKFMTDCSPLHPMLSEEPPPQPLPDVL